MSAKRAFDRTPLVLRTYMCCSRHCLTLVFPCVPGPAQIANRGTDPTMGPWLDVVAPPADHAGGKYSGIALQGAQMLFLLGEAPKKAWGEGRWVTLTTPF